MAACANCEVFKGTATEILAHQKRGCNASERWRPIAEAKERGAFHKAKRLTRELFGIETKPMPEDVIAAKKAAGPTPEVAKRIKKLKKEEIRELSKPANNPRKSRVKSN